MLTININDKHGNDALNFLRDSIANEKDIRVLIEPSQFVEIKKFLESLNFSDILPEDDDGNLFIVASREIETDENLTPVKIDETHVEHVEEPQKIEPQPITTVKPKAEIIKNSTGILISCESAKCNSLFMKKFLSSLVNSNIKPDVIALMNGAVKLAAYNSNTCEYLKTLEDYGVKILISDSCADRMGISEAVGAGVMVDTVDILEEIFVCEKVISI